MRRRPSIRATAAAVLLLLATMASGAVNAASAPAASGATTGPSTSHLHQKSSEDRLKKRPAAHGSMATSTGRRTSGPMPHLCGSVDQGSRRIDGHTGPRARDRIGARASRAGHADDRPGDRASGLRRAVAKSSGPDTNGEPPDPWLGVGPEHVMQVVNSSFRITDRQGVQSEAPTAFAGFVDSFGFPELGDAVWFDPHVDLRQPPRPLADHDGRL